MQGRLSVADLIKIGDRKLRLQSKEAIKNQERNRNQARRTKTFSEKEYPSDKEIYKTVPVKEGVQSKGLVRRISVRNFPSETT